MKFTPEQVIEMAREAGFVVDELSRQHQPKFINHTNWMVDDLLAAICTLAADRALEAAANVCDNKADSMREMSIQQMELDLAADAIRAMKEHQ